jgi:hypothetical protein
MNLDEVSKHPFWKIYGTTQQEGFDPLAFSHKMGDYAKSSQSSGYGNWQHALDHPPYAQ